MTFLGHIRKSLLVSLWFMFLTFPIIVVKVNPIEELIEWRWRNMFEVGLSVFFISLVSYYWQKRGELRSQEQGGRHHLRERLKERFFAEARLYRPVLFLFGLILLVFPVLFSIYQVNILTTALMYVVLGLGLNIVVGLAGLLDLGYVAFYAVGAYSYALLNYHFGLSFWFALPLGGLLGAILGVILGFPVLRLRGDYLAIVTLGFGEIIRLILENWNDFSFGPSGIANIPRPGFFGIELSLSGSIVAIYYLMICLMIFTIFMVSRLQNSRIGRAWIALREDELACQAMGIDKTKTKLSAFALGAAWAGMVGVVFAAKTTFINPASFTFLESAIILSIVVLGGMGSIVGVICGALLLILLPEYLRVFSDYRMLLFGAIMVLMMLFRPEGIIRKVRRTYHFEGTQKRLPE